MKRAAKTIYLTICLMLVAAHVVAQDTQQLVRADKTPVLLSPAACNPVCNFIC